MGADVVSEVLGLRGRDALSPMFLVNEVERGLPLSALDRVAKAVAPGNAGFAFRMVPRATLARSRTALATARDPALRRDHRTNLLIVPSTVARMEHNVLFNPEHPEFPRVTHGLHRPVWWDRRLFARCGVAENGRE